MNEFILKWLATSTIGLVVCSSLWLAGSVQHEVNLDSFANTIGKAASEPKGGKVRLASRPLDPAVPELTVKTSATVN